MPASSPASVVATRVYVSRAAERITASKNQCLPSAPSRPISISQTSARRSTSGFSEHSPFESSSGSIGTTRPGK